MLNIPSAYLPAGMAQPSTAAHTGPAQVHGDRQAAAVPDASVRATRSQARGVPQNHLHLHITTGACAAGRLATHTAMHDLQWHQCSLLACLSAWILPSLSVPAASTTVRRSPAPGLLISSCLPSLPTCLALTTCTAGRQAGTAGRSQGIQVPAATTKSLLRPRASQGQ